MLTLPVNQPSQLSNTGFMTIALSNSTTTADTTELTSLGKLIEGSSKT